MVSQIFLLATNWIKLQEIYSCFSCFDIFYFCGIFGRHFLILKTQRVWKRVVFFCKNILKKIREMYSLKSSLPMKIIKHLITKKLSISRDSQNSNLMYDRRVIRGSNFAVNSQIPVVCIIKIESIKVTIHQSIFQNNSFPPLHNSLSSPKCLNLVKFNFFIIF